MSDPRVIGPRARWRAWQRLRPRALALGALLPLSLAAQRSSARSVQQSADARVTALRERFVRASEHAGRLVVSIDSVTRALSAVPAADSVVAGAIVIRFRGEAPLPGFRAVLAKGAMSAWATATTTLDSATALVAGHPLNLTRTRVNFWDRRPYAVLGFPGRNARWHTFRSIPEAQQLTDAILELYGSLAGERAPIGLKRWTQSAWLPITQNDRKAWERVAVALATSRSSFARRCYEAVIGDCEIALDLVADSTPDPLHSWYRPDDLPALVSEYTGRDSAERATFRACVDGREVRACERAAGLRDIPRPLSGSVKLALVAFAVERGGPGAFSRLIAADGTASHILTVTAGVPLDQLLGEWRTKAVAATPPGSIPSPLEGGTMLVWAAAFVALAARRRP